jgi:predicted amidohydrolase
MADWLPPAWMPGEIGIAPISFEIRASREDPHQLFRDGELNEIGPLETVIGSFELQLRNHVAKAAPDHVFIHAGAAAFEGHAISVPGESFSGKTMLVRALVRAGATYFSDEYTVLDREGFVHPYPKPLAVRDGGDGFRGKSYHPAADIGVVTDGSKARLGMVLCVEYRPGAVWEPEELTPADALVALIPHTFASPDRAAETMATLAAALSASVITLKGDRGEADETAALVLRRLAGER